MSTQSTTYECLHYKLPTNVETKSSLRTSTSTLQVAYKFLPQSLLPSIQPTVNPIYPSRVLHGLDDRDVCRVERIERVDGGLQGGDGLGQVVLAVVADGLRRRRGLVGQGLVARNDLLLGLDLQVIHREEKGCRGSCDLQRTDKNYCIAENSQESSVTIAKKIKKFYGYQILECIRFRFYFLMLKAM